MKFKKLALLFGLSVIFLSSCNLNEIEKPKRTEVAKKIYEVKGSELAENYGNISYYTDKVFNISFRIDHVIIDKNTVDIQYHGGFERDSRYGPRVDIILTLKQAKKYDLQKGKIIKFENMVWTGNKQLKNKFLGIELTFNVMSFEQLIE